MRFFSPRRLAFCPERQFFLRLALGNRGGMSIFAVGKRCAPRFAVAMA